VIETVPERDDVTVTAARRSDRTPPSLVTTSDLGDLGTPVSTGDARAEAHEEAQAEATRRLEHLRATVLARAANTGQALTDRFERLVHRLIAAEIARARSVGDERDPLTVWLDLTRDKATGWSYAKNFADMLRLNPTDLAPGRLRDDDASPAHDVSGFHRHVAYVELAQIMQEYTAFQKTLS